MYLDEDEYHIMYPTTLDSGRHSYMGTTYCVSCGTYVIPADGDEYCPYCKGMGKCIKCHKIYTMDYVRVDLTAAQRLTAKPTRRCKPCNRRPDVYRVIKEFDDE